MIDHSKIRKRLLQEAENVASKNFSKRILCWYLKNREKHPWRIYWEQHQTPYHVWVSEIMLQQTLIKVVTPLYIAFIKKFPDLAALAQAEKKDLQQAVKGLGYYNRFDRLHKAAKFLCEQQGVPMWPATYEEWKKIPGVGDYTASALSSICLNEESAVVDGNVERVLSRIFLIKEEINSYAMKKTLKAVSQVLISSKNPGDYNQGIMELGQKTCLKAKPLCTICPVKSFCKAYAKGQTNKVPVVVQNKKTVDISMTALVVQKRGKILLSHRGENSRFLKNRTGFPLLESAKKKELPLEAFLTVLPTTRLQLMLLSLQINPF